MTGLLTDLYELTMAAGYFTTGKSSEQATFELSIRKLPQHRNFVIVAGQPQIVDYLLNFRFTAEEIDYLRGLPQFAHVSDGFFEMLLTLRFSGDLWTVREGTVLFAGEPVLNVRAPLIEAQILETYLLSAITFQTLIASKAARMVAAAGGRDVVEFGTRRAHTPEAGVLGARAAYIGGCLGTSNTLAGFRFGIPIFGTSAHSWVMSFESETESFRQLQKVVGASTIQLVDTYDSLEGTRKAAEMGRPLWGIRLDSGDLLHLSKAARSILDEAGLYDSKIMASGDLDEYKIRELVRAGAPIDVFGAGTELATSADAPSMATVYKLVELETAKGKRYTAKRSAEKGSLPGAKQIFRFPDHDVLALWDEPAPRGSRPLLEPVLSGGHLLKPLPKAIGAREGAAEMVRELPDCLRQLEPAPPYRVVHSPALRALTEQTCGSQR